jgi:hypothetical protein
MPEEDTTAGTPEANASPADAGAKTEEVKTYTEAEVATLLEGAKKDGQTAAYRHWQSVNDRVVAAERTKSEGLARELQGFKDKAFEALTPEEQTKAVWQELRTRNNAPAPQDDQSNVSPGKPESASTGQAGDEYVTAVRDSVNEALKEANIDPSKVDWADDANGPDAMKRFIKSITAQMKPADAPKGSSEAEKEANRVDTSSGGGSHAVDLKSIDAAALISTGLGKPFKG